MTDKDQARLRPIAAKARSELLRELKFPNDPNIVGAGFGNRVEADKMTETPALVVYVNRKLSDRELPDAARIPSEMKVDGETIDVDVVETGPIYTQAYVLRERPARWGCSIGNPRCGCSGTLGAVVKYYPNGHWGILSNNHVMANSSHHSPPTVIDPARAQKFDPIIQPGAYDGGNQVTDTICWLECWVDLWPQSSGNTNRVDAALAYQDPDGFLINEAMGGWPVATSSTPAVGLLFAGGASRTIYNQISNVKAELSNNFDFLPSGGLMVNPFVGQCIEKTGRTTEHTEGRVREVDVTVQVGGYRFGSAVFTGQFTTTPMSLEGDSGSVGLQKNGECAVSFEPVADVPVWCPMTVAVEMTLGVPVQQDYSTIIKARDRYLRKTKVGSYVLDVFYKNEIAIADRVATTDVSEADRKLAQALYSKYVGDFKYAITSPEQAGQLMAYHLVDLSVAVRELRKYQSDNEARATADLLEIARGMEGKSLDQIMDALNDDALARRVRSILGESGSVDVD